MPALASSILDPLWVQVVALLPTRQVYHPLGRHHPRIAERVIFDKLIQIVFGCGYRRIADHSCSATTLRRRRDEWTTLGLVDQLHRLALTAYHHMLGLDLNIWRWTAASPRRPAAARSPGQGRSTAANNDCNAHWPPTPMGAAGGAAGPGQPPQATGCWPPPWTPRRSSPPRRSVRCPRRPRCTWTPATTTRPAGMCWPTAAWSARPPPVAAGPIQADRRWLIERTYAWFNQYGKLRWCSERRRVVVECWLRLALALLVVGRLIPRAWTNYRWQARPRRRP